MACSKDVLGPVWIKKKWFMAVKGLFGKQFMTLLWHICGWFCGLNCECSWHVQRMF